MYFIEMMLCSLLAAMEPDYIYYNIPNPEQSRTYVWTYQESGDIVKVPVINEQLPMIQLYKKNNHITHVVLTYGDGFGTPFESAKANGKYVYYSKIKKQPPLNVPKLVEPVPIALPQYTPWDYMKKPSEVK